MDNKETIEQLKNRLIIQFLTEHGVTPDEVNLVLVGHSQYRELKVTVSVY